eukprot:2575131-Pleurochrysis_carterae.AAC.6
MLRARSARSSNVQGTLMRFFRVQLSSVAYTGPHMKRIMHRKVVLWTKPERSSFVNELDLDLAIASARICTHGDCKITSVKRQTRAGTSGENGEVASVSWSKMGEAASASWSKMGEVASASWSKMEEVASVSRSKWGKLPLLRGRKWGKLPLLLGQKWGSCLCFVVENGRRSSGQKWGKLPLRLGRKHPFVFDAVSRL